jgi:hypothetical protein
MSNLQDPHSIDVLQQAGKYAPGFFGSLIATYYLSKPASKLEVFGSLFAGTLSATYVGPYAAHILAADIPNVHSGIHFLVGACTVVFVPLIVRRVQELIVSFDWQMIKEMFTWKKIP